MSSVQFVNSKAEILRKAQALAMNINAGKGLFEVMKSNLGPRGTLKMLVSGGGLIKLSKDGNVLLNEMQIQHPTAAMIARCSTAQDVTVGDGTTSNTLFIGELLKNAEKLICDGLHPRIITDGYEKAKEEALKILEECRIKVDIDDDKNSSKLFQVISTSLKTKLIPNLAEMMAPITCQALQNLREYNDKEDELDLHMVEVMHMKHRVATETRLVNGLVLDHGGRHEKMPKKLGESFVLICNFSLEYEKTEVNSGFYFSNAEQRERLAASERALTDERCRRVIELKREVCKNGEGFVVINLKGIDPVCLEMLAKEGILALRRAKRRNMERLMKCCGGKAVNSSENMTADILGKVGKVTQESLGDDSYTMMEDCPLKGSCTVLIKGPDDHTISILKEALRDGLRAGKNLIDDKSYISGAGSFETHCYNRLKEISEKIEGKLKLGFLVFAESLLVIPKVLSENSGYDIIDSISQLIDENKKNGKHIGLNINEIGVIDADKAGIFDNYKVKKQFLTITSTLAQQLILCDEILKAGKKMGGKGPGPAPGGMPGGMPPGMPGIPGVG